MIELPLPRVWSFWDFVYANDNNPVEDWYQKELSDDAQLLFDAILKDIYKIAIPRHWNPFRGFLKGKYKESKIWELGFFADGRQYRILGIFDPVRRKQAILLCGCYHKQKVYTPADALDTAYKRAKALADRKAKLHERKIKDNI